MSSEPSRLRVTEQDEVTRINFIDRNILDEANIRQIGGRDPRHRRTK